MLLAIFSALVKYGGTDLSLFMSSAGDLAAMVQAPAWMAHGSMEGVREWSPAPAYFLVFAALFKAASLPFHGWLLGSLEAPTPVSALLHAGIINAGGFLLIRFQHLFEGHPHALVLLAILALPSVVLGPLAMWSQTDYKRGLAWSTIGQMGFMLLQCALGAFGPALLHLFGHGLYKANAFLRSGELAGMTEPGARSARTLPGPAGMVLALLASAAGLGAVYTLLLGNPGAVPGGWVLFSIQSLAVAQLALSPIARGPAFSGRMAASFIAGLGYAGVTVAFESLFAPVMAGLPALEMQGGAGLAAGGIALLALVTLTSLWLGMAWWIRKPWGKTLYVAAAHGYYLNPALTGGLASFRTQARLASLPATSAKKEVT